MKNTRVKGWALIRLALTIIGKKGLAELKKASLNAENQSALFLRNIIEESKDTVYGKERNFDEILKAQSVEEFFEAYKKNVPLNSYEDLSPYIERHKNGEPNVLFPGKPKMYATTSGTTKEPKWIPITENYYKDVYKVMNQLWFYTLIMNKPKVFYGRTLSIVGKAIEGAAPDGTVYGSISGIAQRDIPNFLKVVYSAPAEVFKISDYKARYYTLMRFGIEQNITLIITANPSTLVEMQVNANEFYDEYVNDIERGTLSSRVKIEPEIRSCLESYLKPNRKRAKELRELKERHGTVLPKHYWPHMQIVNVWMCGNTKVYCEKIKDSFSDSAVFHEFGYFSTECKSGIVLTSNTLDTVLFGHKMYFEFIHESEIDKNDPKVYQLNEVKKGERYCMVVTTAAGLYRYNTNDIIEITGFYNQFPTIKFIQKCNGIISMTGEKLHERQFIDAVRTVEKETGLELNFFVGFANVEKSNYSFYFEFQKEDVTQAEAESFSADLDKVLQTYNVEYGDKRASDRIKEPETSLLVKNSFEKFKAACIERGFRDGQFKLNLLMQDEKRQQAFKELIKPSPKA
ncbi:MAG: GH3 auxin-responsive promoter family protein [Spirochaetaceae bacterium]|jgi:hypothetical protein|nr:GH3 auxin-responsive promoter family protein [Spirochaetaceae bacterium]